MAPDVIDAITEFETKSNGLVDIQERKKIVASIFGHFPRKIPGYMKIIEVLTILAGNNTENILKELINQSKFAILSDQSSIFNSLISLVPIYNNNIAEHRYIMFYLTLFFISDLITKIIKVYGTHGTDNSLCDLVYSMSFCAVRVPSTAQVVFDQWSIILSLVSKSSTDSIISLFDALIQSESYLSAFYFTRFAQFDVVFPIFIFYDISRRGFINSEICEAALFLFFSAPLDEQLYLDIYHMFQDSDCLTRVGICSVILQRISSKESEIRRLIKKKILTKVRNEKTLKQCILAFWLNITNASYETGLVFTHQIFSTKKPKMEIMKFHSNLVSSKFLISSYSTSFFEKSDFSKCQGLFAFLTAHLAAIDFSEFMSILFPKFLKLDIQDSRFICFLRMVKYVNDPQFQGLATKEQISDFNNRIARKIRYYYYYFDPTNEPSGIRMFGFKTRSSPLIAECQQKVAMFLALSQIDFIKYTEFTPTISYSDHDNNLNSAMIKAIQFIFNESDYHDDKFMNLIISYMYNANTCVSKHSHEIWDKFYKKDSKFIDILLNRIPLLVDDNQVYCCVRLLFASIEANLEFTAEQYEKMEYIAFLCLAWHLPDIRACGIHLLGKTKREISTILFSNKNLLIKRMKLKLKRYSIHHYNQDAEISLSAIYNSYYYDLWTLFLYELMQFFIEKGHKNIMENIQKLLDRNYSANRGYLIFYINTFYFQQNEEFQEIPDPQNQPEETENERIVVEILHKLMTSGKREFQHNVITAIPLVHKSLVIPCLQTLAMVEEEDIQDATKALLMFINNIGCQIINGEHQAVILPLIIQFLSILHNYFIHVDINSPRVIKWDKQHEELVLKNLNFIIDYCRIIHSSFNSNAEISDDVWPSPSRDLMFRFLINWAMTKSDKLQQLRNNAITAMSTMVKVGAIFNDAILFDSVILNLFGRIERRTKNFFSSLLYYHLELLLETFIDACFTQPRQISDLYINAIIRSATKHQIVYMLSGPMLLLAFVLKHINHPKADEFLNLFLKISLMRPRKPISYDALAKKLKTESYLDLIPEYCSYATEAIFHTGFKLLQQKTISISVSDICKAMTPWITNLRLLPKQSSCTLTSTKHFNYFTPYNFLVKMIETTEKSDDDGFAVLVPLWTELMKSPDHRELVLLFLINWRKSDTKKRIFTILRKDESIVQRLCMNISFAYYYHTTESQKRNFSNEIWVVPIIFDAFKTKWDLLEEHLIDVIHFVFLFNEDDTHDFFSFICEQFNIDDVDPIAAVKPFLEQVNPEEWGNEALKWIIGCRNLNLVLRSFKIYNQILKPIDSDIAKLIAKTVLFHLKTNEDTKLLNDLIAESFFFFAAAFQDNELYSLQYLMCFIDSPYYKTISTQLLVKVLTSRKTSGQSWPSIIGMVDPLLTKIEDNEQIQKLFELFLKTTHNEELMMLVAPIKKNNPALFPSSLTFDKLFSTVSESIMCKVLPKYARMMTSASRSLMDSIFEISSMILDKIVDENNYPSLSQIYKFALHTLLECPHSITFLNILNQKAANVSSLSIPDNLEYERNLDDVQRALERLPQFVETSFNSITDCKTFLSVANFLDVNVSPTILPFGAQQEMVDGMIRTSQTIRMKKTASLKKLNAQQSSAGMSFRSGMMGFVPILKVSQDTVLKPLFHPTALLPREKVCSEIPDADLIMDEADFLRSIDL